MCAKLFKFDVLWAETAETTHGGLRIVYMMTLYALRMHNLHVHMWVARQIFRARSRLRELHMECVCEQVWLSATEVTDFVCA